MPVCPRGREAGVALPALLFGLPLRYNGKYTGGCVIGGLLLLLGLALTWVGFRWRSRSMTVSGNLMSSG